MGEFSSGEAPVKIDVSPAPLGEALPLRELYRQEMNCEIIHDSLPGRGLGDLFLIRADGRVAGSGFEMGYRGEPNEMLRDRSRSTPVVHQRVRGHQPWPYSLQVDAVPPE
jgi:hypothetical protein